MNDPRFEIAVARALAAEREIERAEHEARPHNRRMAWIVVGIALWLAAMAITLFAFWPTR